MDISRAEGEVTFYLFSADSLHIDTERTSLQLDASEIGRLKELLGVAPRDEELIEMFRRIQQHLNIDNDES